VKGEGQANPSGMQARVNRTRASTSSVTLGALFLGFLEIALSSFGGALAWTRRVVVERRGWLTEREFAETLGLCQLLPGGNVINVAVCVGARYRGALGSVAAVSGLLLAPLLIVVLLGVLYAQGAQLGPLRAAPRGAAAVGLLVATGLKMALPYRRPTALAMIALAFVAAGLLRLPLMPVLLVVAPLGVGLAWWGLR
jgi:chromate transporter